VGRFRFATNFERACNNRLPSHEAMFVADRAAGCRADRATGDNDALSISIARLGKLAYRCLVICSSIGVGAGGARAADASHPVVVELIQSQGCSSCPSANANLNALSGRPDVLALSFAVTYWDSLGWKDTFAKAQFTDRQWGYARAMHQGSVYTPQVVVNGRVEGVGADPGEIENLMSRADRTAPGPDIVISGSSVEIGAAAAPSQAADVWLARYEPRSLDVPVSRGENAGKTLPHRNIVREFVRLGAWRGQAERFELPAGASGLGTAILVQTYGAGPILAASKG